MTADFRGMQAFLGVLGERQVREALQLALRELLARIFRDGGQRAESFGDIFEAAEAAGEEVVKLLAAYDELAVTRAELQLARQTCELLQESAMAATRERDAAARARAEARAAAQAKADADAASIKALDDLVYRLRLQLRQHKRNRAAELKVAARAKPKR